MKSRSLVIASLSVVLAVLVCPGAAAENGRKLSLGLGAGGGPVGAPSWPSWRAGFEMGLRFCGHLALAAGVSYGALSVSTSSSAGSYSAREDQTWTALPVTLVARYEAPLSDRAIISLGAGAGYHSFSRKIESETNAYGTPLSSSTESSFHAWAPQAEIGLEILLGKAFSLTGGLRYEFGIASQESTVNGISSVQEFSFGGPSLVIGARVYLF